MTQYPEELAPLDRPLQSRGWGLVKDAVRGTAEDYTEGPIGRSLVLLAVPMVLETVMESLFALADVFWVSRLGAAAVTTVGLTETWLTLLYTLALGLSIGVTATVARRMGEKDPDAAARATVQAIALGAVLSAVIGVLGAVYAAELLALLGAAPEVVESGSGYTRIMFAGNATILFLFLLNAAFRGVGDAVIAMRVLWIANALNMVLDPALIFGWGPFPELGLEGAAVATNLGRGAAVAIQLVTLARSSGRLRVRRVHLRLDMGATWRLVRLSSTGTFQLFVSTASWIVLVRILSDYGTGVIAGYTIAIRMVMFALLPSWGLSNAAATMVGQALGAGKPERAERAARLAGFYNMAFLGAVGIVFIAFAPTIVSWFTIEPEPLEWGARGLRIVAFGFPFYAWGMVLTQSFNGAGDTWTPTWIALACFWGIEQPTAWILSRGLDIGPTGVFLAVTVAYSAVAVVSGILFRRGGWKSATA